MPIIFVWIDVTSCLSDQASNSLNILLTLYIALHNFLLCLLTGRYMCTKVSGWWLKTSFWCGPVQDVNMDQDLQSLSLVVAQVVVGSKLCGPTSLLMATLPAVAIQPPPSWDAVRHLSLFAFFLSNSTLTYNRVISGVSFVITPSVLSNLFIRLLSHYNDCTVYTPHLVSSFTSQTCLFTFQTKYSCPIFASGEVDWCIQLRPSKFSRRTLWTH